MEPKKDGVNNTTNGHHHHGDGKDVVGNGDASASAAVGTTNDLDEKAHSFRKRRLSLSHKREDDGNEDHESSSSAKRMRRNSEVSAASIDSSGNYNLKSRTSHAAELLAQPPPSPAATSTLPKLYQQAAPPQQLPLLDTLGDSNTAPKWKKRHTRHKDEKSLPFPRDIVGTYSCHGVEPIYDEDYRYGNVEEDFEEEEEEEDEDDNGWIVGNPGLGGKKVVAEKPTMAAKINQDRGGVAFPYGNCPKTALFAVYDGT